MSGESPPAGSKGQEFSSVSDKVMASLSAQGNPPDVLGVFRQRIAETFPLPDSGDTWVALDTIRDPGNLGTIIRTANAAGAAGVILIGQSCDPWSPECVRATMGSIFAVPLFAMSESHSGCRRMARRNRRHRGGRQDRLSPPLSPARSGHEGSEERIFACRPSESPRAHTDGGTQSLNVATATAIMLYEIRRPELV